VNEIQAILSESRDRENPGADELRDLLVRTRRIAVVGLSRFPEKPSLRIPAYMVSRGYVVVPVNPHAERVLNQKAYPTLSEVPDAVDLVMIFRPSDQAGAFVSEALARPERPAIWLSEGIRADREIAEARRRGVPAVQDLCAYKVHSALGLSRREPLGPAPHDPSG
jgi:predicted CoA-binding protein